MSAKKPILRRSRTTTARTHTRDQVHDLLDESHRRLVREEVDRQFHARSIQCRPTRERPDDRISDSALTAHVLMQMAVILAFCRAVGWAARFVGQPQVVAEMIAGFLIAPLVFGWLVRRPAGALPRREPALPVRVQARRPGISGLQALVFVGAAMSITRRDDHCHDLDSVSAVGMVYRRVNALGRISRVDAPLTNPSP